MANRVDLSKTVDEGGYAKYLPAVSTFLTVQHGKATQIQDYIDPARMPAEFEHGIEGLNFLNKDKGYFHYKYALYSAGHAERNLAKFIKREPMIACRDRENTVVVSDSGGFQLATGVIKVDWTTFAGSGGDKFREEILRFSEASFDYSMTLDVPGFACDGKMGERTGLKTFKDTLDLSIINLNYFIKNRVPGATKFLNVISGGTPETSKEWFDAVIPYSVPDYIESLGYDRNRTLDGGWAFAGVNMKNMVVTLTRIMEIRDLGLLETNTWMHFLGLGRLDWACFLTSIQRQIKKHHNPDFTISYDAASPFVATAYGLCYNYNYFTPKKLTYSMDKAVDKKSFKGSKLRMPFQSPIMDRLTVGDICVLGPNDTNKQGKIGNTSWDSITYAFYMSHNVYNHITAVQEINRLADIEHHRYNVSYKDWSKSKRSSMANEVSQFVPSSILFFESFVQELFDPATADPYKLIEDNRQFLESISFGGTTSNTFKSLFDEVVPEVEEDKFADLNDERLQELEGNGDE